MANRYLIANGDINNPAVWDGGTLPDTADDLYSNNFVGTVSVSMACKSLRNSADTGITLGGGWEIEGNLTVTVEDDLVAAAAGLIRWVGDTDEVSDIIANELVTSITNAVAMDGLGKLRLYLNIRATGNGNIVFNPSVSGGGGLEIHGDVSLLNINQRLFGSSFGVPVKWVGDLLAFAGGSQVVGGVSSALYAGDFEHTGSMDIEPTGIWTNAALLRLSGRCVLMGSYRSSATHSTLFTTNPNNEVTGLIRQGNSASFHCIAGNSSNNAGMLFSGTMLSHNGLLPFNDIQVRLKSTEETSIEFSTETIGTEVTLYSTAPGLNAPDLREGTVVGSVTGTLAVPPPSTVADGVPTDDTVGTLNLVATVDAAALHADLKTAFYNDTRIWATARQVAALIAASHAED